tara:strand:- start:60 stop:557 length:498 start_codon:yes stop_codon:yes gene_type:complete
MTIDATFWVAISFFIFLGGLIYLKVPQKINSSLTEQINKIRKQLEESEKLKVEAKNLLSDYENKIDRSKKESQNITNQAKKDSETEVLKRTKNFHELMDVKKKNIEQKIIQMKENALKDIKNVSIEVSMQAVEKIIKNSIDKNKLDKLYLKSLEQTKAALKKAKA